MFRTIRFVLYDRIEFNIEVFNANQMICVIDCKIGFGAIGKMFNIKPLYYFCRLRVLQYILFHINIISIQF